MRVLHIITGLAAGGAEHQLRLLLRHLCGDPPAGSRRPAVEVEVVALTNPGVVADAIRADGIPVHVLGMRGNRDLGALPRLIGLIRAGRFDVVHTHLYRACVYGRIAARLAGVRRVVATEHSLGDGLIEGRRITAGVRMLYLAAERIAAGPTIAVSQAVEQRLVAWGVPPTRVRVLPNGVDAGELGFDPALRRAARARYGIAPDARVVGGLGRLAPTKRFDLLIEAVRELPDVTLLLAGAGSAGEALRAQAAAAGVTGRVVFAGAQAHAREVLCAMDILAAPSEQETFGLAVIEALGNGLPVLYVTCPPLEELGPASAPGATRLPAEAAPFREALRAALSTMDTDDGSHRNPVPPAVHHYDVTRLAAAVGDLYADLVGRPDGPRHDQLEQGQPERVGREGS